MPAGQRVTANASLTSGGSNTFTAGDFSTVDGTGLSSSDAVVVSGYIHGDSVSINRVGDPDSDSTFEIDIAIESRTGAGERTDVTHVVTDVAGLKVSEDASTSQEVTLYGVRVDASKVFVEQSASVSGGSEVARTTGSRGQHETIYELAFSDAADLIRRHDPNDDGTFELAATVESYSGADVIREAMLPMSDESGRSNAEMETALQASGGSRDLLIAGSVGVSL